MHKKITNKEKKKALSTWNTNFVSSHHEEAEIAPIILQSSQPITIIGRDTEVHGE